MIEQLNPDYLEIMNISDHKKRWERMLRLDQEDHASFRVLFGVETVATMEWKEPTPERLSELLSIQLKGQHLAMKFDDIFHIIQSVWPLQLAKKEVQKMRLIWETGECEKYPFGSISLPIVSCITGWWALETMFNEIAGILRDIRGNNLTSSERLYIEEKTATKDKKGRTIERTAFQPIETRMKFIFRLATGNVLETSNDLWLKAVALKDVRDVVIHRLAKAGTDLETLTKLHNEAVEGIRSVSMLLKRIFIETPEFRERHVYHYLAYWACEVESPVFWDGREGDGIYFGPAKPKAADILSTIAPEPAFITTLK